MQSEGDKDPWGPYSGGNQMGKIQGNVDYEPQYIPIFMGDFDVACLLEPLRVPAFLMGVEVKSIMNVELS